MAVTLSPFQVTADSADSYEALNTSGVTGTNRSIRSLPITMTAYTRALIDELNVTDLTQLYTYTPNVTLSADGSGGGNGSPEQFRLRGITSKEERRRNGFLSLAKADIFSTARVEMLRGAQALLYGQGTAGGVVNTVTKSALASRFAEVNLRFDNFGTQRATLDINEFRGPFSMRVVGLAGTQKFWQDNLIDRPRGAYIALAARLGSRFTVHANHEYYEENARNRHLSNTTLRDNTGRDVRANVNLDQLLYTGGNLSGIFIGGAPISYDNFRSAQSSFTLRKQYSNTTTVALEGEINSRLSARIAWNHQTMHNYVERSGTNDLAAPTDTNAIDGQWSLRVDPMTIRNFWNLWAVQASAVYRFEVGKFLKNQLVVGAENRLKEQYFTSQRLYQLDGSGAFVKGTADAGRVRLPIFYVPVQNRYANDRPIPSGYAWADQAELNVLAPTPANPRGIAGTGLTWRIEKQIAGYANWLGTWWDGRMESMAGVRVDSISLVNEHRYQTLADTSKTSGTVGVVYNIMPSLGLYTNASRSFAAAGTFDPTPDNTFPQPGYGTTAEAGLKFDLWGKRISGSLAFFDNRGQNEALSLSGAVQDAFNPAGINGRNGGSGAVADVRSRGVELTVTAQPRKGWRVMFGAGTNDAKMTSSYSHAVFYNDEFNTDGTTVKIKQSDGSLTDLTVPVTPSNPSGPRTPLTLAMMRDSSSPYFAQIDPTSGRILNATNLALTTAGVRTGTTGLPISRHQLGFVARNGGIFDAIQPGDFTTPNAALTISGHTMYEIRTGPLRGLFLGGTVRWQHDIRQGYTIINGVRQLYYQPDFAVVDLRSGYEIKAGRQKWKLQLTLQNLLDEQPVIKTRSATTGALSNVNVTEAARTFILSASVRL